MPATLYYVHDPMCSWCWAFEAAWTRLLAGLPAGVTVCKLLGGLAPDSDEPMPEEMRRQLQATWRRIEARVPGTRFNFAFWERCTPRRATYPACRAVLAARAQGDRYSDGMVRAIQRAYYQEARNPSDHGTLVALAEALGLEHQRFEQALTAAETQRRLLEEIALARSLGVHAFPGLVLALGEVRWTLPVDYTDADAMLATLRGLLAGDAASSSAF